MVYCEKCEFKNNCEKDNKKQNENFLSLSDLKKNQCGQVLEIIGETKFKRRLLELGFIKGTKVKILHVSPFKSSFLIDCSGSIYALKRKNLCIIKVILINI